MNAGKNKEDNTKLQTWLKQALDDYMINSVELISTIRTWEQL